MNQLLDKEQQVFLPTYKRIPFDIKYGEGIFFIDKNDVRYLDFFAGLAVNAVGYAHPKIIKAVTDQISKFAHLSNYFVSDVQNKFADKLLGISESDKVFLTNSGTEATEAAIKLIRKKYGPYKKIFSLSNSFHGRTYGALSITNRPKYQKGFEPLLQNCDIINFNDVADLRKKVNADTAAVFIEFIQGEGGINEISKQFSEELNSLKQKYDFVIVADEIQCGIGRTGRNFAFNYYNFKPDLILVAKAIGGGLPLGALLVSKNLIDVFSYGEHGTTFGGNPVACAAGLVVMEEIFENGLLENVYNLGIYFKSRLEEIKNKFQDKVKDIRGKGFMIGAELSFQGQIIVDEMFKRKILTNCTNNNVIRILPPFIAQKEHIEFYLNNFEEILSAIKLG